MKLKIFRSTKLLGSLVNRCLKFGELSVRMSTYFLVSVCVAKVKPNQLPTSRFCMNFCMNNNILTGITQSRLENNSQGKELNKYH